jgi:hypothetical protein
MSFIDFPTLPTNQAILATVACAAVAGVLFAAVRGVKRWRSTRLELSEPPPLLIPVQRRGSVPPPLYPMRGGLDRTNGSTAAGRFDGGALGPTGVASAETVASSQREATPGRNGHSAPSPSADSAPSLTAATASRTNSGTASKVVHTMPPMDGTLQFLPGRLEVVDGEAPGRDIRFVRTWGEVPEITFGRVSGPPYRHVQLRSQTVSRQHARMQYMDARWKLTNLSQTNPVVVNGQALDTTHGNRVLHDGDQIEMGEVVFRFRER